ncbi:50S ribosomal protein L10 [Candidatus Parcubacteria bacterium]|nr:50S ribosomal protein L10 [Candidatus Parcubacteria bacterium]
MALTKQKKTEVFQNLKDAVKKAVSVVFINFHGLTVSDATKVRKELKTKGVNYTVAKKTLAKKAFADAGIKGELPNLEGELALVYSDTDALDSPREIYQFEKKLDKKISIMGGIFDGIFINKERMTSIALIPPLKTLHAQFVNLVNSPIQGFVMALSEIAKKKS